MWERDVVDALFWIKRAVLDGRYVFSDKADIERELDNLTELDVIESILNAGRVVKRIRSTSRQRRSRREYLYVVRGKNHEGTEIYTKGKFVHEPDQEFVYFLISSKRAT